MTKLYFIYSLVLCFWSTETLRGQNLYESSQVKHHFAFYKNGQSIDRLNDSITTSFYKKNDSLFSIKFYINKKFVKECSCVYQGKITTRRGVWYEDVNGKLKPNYRQYKLKELNFADSTCISFLPKSLR